MSINSCQRHDRSTANLENSLNNLGYLPLVSTVSGSVRTIYGVAQSILGAVGATLRSVQYLVTRDPAHRLLAGANMSMAKHGSANIIRGDIEFVPVVGNVTTFFYDNLLNLRFNYFYENLNGKDPLNFHHKDLQLIAPPKSLPGNTVRIPAKVAAPAA